MSEACFADSPSLFLSLICFEPHFRNITGRSGRIRSTQLLQNSSRSHIQSCSIYIFNLLRYFTMMISIFRPTAGSTAKQDFKCTCQNLTQSQREVLKKNTGGRETTGIWNLVICWFFGGFCGVDLPCGLYSCRMNTRDNSQLFFLQFLRIGKSVSLCQTNGNSICRNLYCSFSHNHGLVEDGGIFER